MFQIGSSCFSNMKAKLVREGIEDILKPKDESEILNALKNSSVTEVIKKYGDDPVVWKSLAERGMNPEEMFRNAFSADSGVGVDYAIDHGAKGKYMSDQELIDGFLGIDKSKRIYDFIIKKIPPTKLYKSFDLGYKTFGGGSDDRLHNFVNFLSKNLNVVPEEDLMKILQNGGEKKGGNAIVDLIATKMNPKKMFNGLRDTTNYRGGKDYPHPAKEYLLKKYPASFSKEFIIRQAIKNKFTNIIIDNYEDLKDFYNAEQILKLMLKIERYDYVKKTLKDVNLKKIHPNEKLYDYLDDEGDIESIEILLNSGNNSAALLQTLKGKSWGNRALSQMIKNTSSEKLSPNARQGAAVKEAVKKKDANLVKRYLAHPDISQNTMYNAFNAACAYGNQEIVQMFLDHDKIDPKSIWIPGLLVRAAEMANLDALQTLINDQRIKKYKDK